MLNIKKVKLMANYILVTNDKYDGIEKSDGIIIPKGTLKEYQTVVAVGPVARNIKEGDIVCVNPKRYAVYKYKEGSLKGDVEQMQKVVSYNFNTITMDHKSYLLITDQDIDFIIEEYDVESDDKSNLILPKQEIIV